MTVTTGPDAIGRVITALATPFLPDGSLDLPGAAVLARHVIASGSDGLVLGGTTGESPTLRDTELWDLVSAVREAVPDGARITVGTGTNDTSRSAERTVRATEAGADGVLVVTPYYNRPSQAGLVAHFTAVASATDLPVLLYDIPSRTGREIDVDTLVTLSRVPNIIGVKDATGRADKTADVVLATHGAPGGFDVWSGSDEVNLPLLSVGAVGVVSVAAHFPAVASATDLPVLLYDVPSRTGREIDVDTLVTLSRVPNIIGVKDATCRADKSADVVLATRGAPGGFDVWSGSDEVNLPLLSVGAVGVVSVAAHLAGPEIAEMVAVHTTDPIRARELHLACMPLHRALFLEPNPGPLKAALRARGLPAGPVRLPLADTGADVSARVLDALSALEARRNP